MQNNESVQFLSQTLLTGAEWINYYQNIWCKNTIARTIDVQTDMNALAKNPNEMVQADGGAGDPRGMQFIPLATRLEHRKIAVQDALAILEAIKNVGEHADIEAFYWNDEFLAVAPEFAKATITEEEAAPVEGVAVATEVAPETTTETAPVAPETAQGEAEVAKPAETTEEVATTNVEAESAQGEAVAEHTGDEAKPVVNTEATA